MATGRYVMAKNLKYYTFHKLKSDGNDSYNVTERDNSIRLCNDTLGDIITRAQAMLTSDAYMMQT